MTAWHSQISVPRHGPQDKGMKMGLKTPCETNHNLDQKCKIAWLRSLLFWMAIDLDIQAQI